MRAMPELRRRRENGSDRRRRTTCDVDVHDAGASPDAVGRVADVGAGQVVGHRPLEEQGVVFDLHVAGQGAVQPVEIDRERDRKRQ